MPAVSEEIMLTLYKRAGGVPRYVFRRADISLQYNLDPKIKKDEIVKKSLERVESALLQVKTLMTLYCASPKTPISSNTAATLSTDGRMMVLMKLIIFDGLLVIYTMRL